MSTGSADGGQTAGQDASEDLVRVREAASAVGVTVPAVHYWIRSGRLTVQPGPGGRRVSVADVRAVAQQQARRRAMGRNDSPQPVPEDLVSVREAAQAAGFSVASVYTWIKSGWLTALPSPRGRRVSMSAVRALRAAPDPQAPDEARPVSEVAPAVSVPSWRIAGWLRRGLLPSWRGRYGRLVLVEDVRALAQQRPTRLSATGEATPMPADALFIRDVVRLSGVTKGRIYLWMRKGLLPFWPGTGTGQRVRLADVTVLAERQERGLPLNPGGAP